MTEDPSGWTASAPGWIAHIEEGNMAREVLLDPVMSAWCKDVEGLRALDVGSGEGRFCRMLTGWGAKAIGIEPTPPLLAHAVRLGKAGAYVRGVGEKLPFTSAQFDLVVMYLVLIDIPDFRAAISEAARVLKPGGKLAVANLAPHASTLTTGWVRDEAGQKLYYPIDNYLEERAMIAAWKTIEIVNFHRPLSAYMAAFLGSGLILKAYEEPSPTPEEIERNPDWQHERRVPYVHAMLWQKPT
jgi:SAM-dependent methyltransferase